MISDKLSTNASSGAGKPSSGSLNVAEFKKFAHFRLALFEFQRRTEAVLDQFDIGSRQFYAMLIIKSRAGDKLVTVGTVARGMDIHPSSASGLIARLESAGLAERIFDLENRRKVRVRLTGDGEALLAQIVASDSRSASDIREEYQQLLGFSEPRGSSN